MKFWHFFFWVWAIFVTLPLQSMPEDETNSSSTPRRQLTKVRPSDPQTYESEAALLSQLIIALPFTSHFRPSQIYHQTIWNGLVRWSNLTQELGAPVLYQCSGTQLFALAVDGHSVDETRKMVTHFTHKVFLFNLNPSQITFCEYMYSDGTSEIYPTVAAEESEVTNLLSIPCPVTQPPQDILPYEITRKGFQCLSLMIRNRSGRKYQFTPVPKDSVLNQ